MDCFYVRIAAFFAIRASGTLATNAARSAVMVGLIRAKSVMEVLRMAVVTTATSPVGMDMKWTIGCMGRYTKSQLGCNRQCPHCRHRTR